MTWARKVSKFFMSEISRKRFLLTWTVSIHCGVWRCCLPLLFWQSEGATFQKNARDPKSYPMTSWLFNDRISISWHTINLGFVMIPSSWTKDSCWYLLWINQPTHLLSLSLFVSAAQKCMDLYYALVFLSFRPMQRVSEIQLIFESLPTWWKNNMPSFGGLVSTSQ